VGDSLFASDQLALRASMDGIDRFYSEGVGCGRGIARHG
jgi:hypothetical protein